MKRNNWWELYKWNVIVICSTLHLVNSPIYVAVLYLFTWLCTVLPFIWSSRKSSSNFNVCKLGLSTFHMSARKWLAHDFRRPTAHVRDHFSLTFSKKADECLSLIRENWCLEICTEQPLITFRSLYKLKSLIDWRKQENVLVAHWCSVTVVHMRAVG